MRRTLVSGFLILLSICSFGQVRDYTAGKISVYRVHAVISPCFVLLEIGEIRLDGAVKLGYILNDPALIRKAFGRLDRVINGVLNGADNFICWKPDTIGNEFNVWAHFLMGSSLVSYYQATS